MLFKNFRKIMEDSTSEEKKKDITTENVSNSNYLNNNNDINEKNENLTEEINNIINNINKDFDFKSFEQEKMDTIEKVIKFNILILLLNIAFNTITINYIRKRIIIIRTMWKR